MRDRLLLRALHQRRRKVLDAINNFISFCSLIFCFTPFDAKVILKMQRRRWREKMTRRGGIWRWRTTLIPRDDEIVKWTDKLQIYDLYKYNRRLFGTCRSTEKHLRRFLSRDETAEHATFSFVNSFVIHRTIWHHV